MKIHKWLICMAVAAALTLLAACGDVSTEVASTQEPTAAVPTSTATPMPTPTITPSPTPTPESVWQCYKGGPACYADLSYVVMLNAEEGWATGRSETSRSMVLHYTTAPGNVEPTWQYISPSKGIPRFWSLSMVSPTEGWALSEGGILHYQDGVWQRDVWTSDYLGLIVDFDMVSAEEGWGVGASGNIVHFFEGTSQNSPRPTKVNLYGIDMVTPDEGWAVGVYSTLLHYTDGVWEEIVFEPEYAVNPTFYDIEMVNGNEGWAVGNTIIHYQNGEWREVFNEAYRRSIEDEIVSPLSALDMVTAEDGWAVDNMGCIYHYQGDTWQKVESPTTQPLDSIHMLNAEEGWAVGRDSTILHYKNGVWQLVATVEPYEFWELWKFDNTVWAMGMAEEYQNSKFRQMWHYVDGEWQKVGNAAPVRDVDMLSSDEAWALGSEKGSLGDIFRYREGVWQHVFTSISQLLSDIDMVNEDEGWAVGEDGVIIHYVEGKWYQAESPTDEWLTEIVMVNENEGWAIGNESAILHYQKGRWGQITHMSETLREIDMTDEENGWIAGANTLLRYRDGVWQEVPFPQEDMKVAAMDMVSGDEGWLMGDKILHYRGGEWEIFDKPPIGVINDIVMLNEYEGWAVGYYGILYYGPPMEQK